MSRRLVFAIAVGLILSGCTHGSECYLPPPTKTLANWNGRSFIGALKKAKSTKPQKTSGTTAGDGTSAEAELAGLRPYSPEWWSVRDSIDRAAEAKLAKKLIICRDCMPSNPDDQTSSIARK